ncbi:MAG: hypothetical protein RLZZ124_523 [Cyanobacteriota bacterium]
MTGSLEEAYVAVERAYGQGDFTRALQLAESLRPQVQKGRPDLLDHRLELLVGHIHLYGLNQPEQAANAYNAVLQGCSEPSYRELAGQGLALSRQPGGATQAGQPLGSTPGAPATPWMSQPQVPQQALPEIEAAGAVPAGAAATELTLATPAPWQENAGAAAAVGGEESEAAATGEPAPDPAAIIPVVVTVEEEPVAASVETTTAVAAGPGEMTDEPLEESSEADSGIGVNAEAEAEAAAAPATPAFSEEEWADFSRGLLLVELTSTTAPPSR